MLTTLILIAALGLVAALGASREGRRWLRQLAGSELGALTLAEAAKLSNDIVLQGVYESIIKASDISLVLPFSEITGNGITYNRENVAPTVAMHDVGDAWTEGVATFTQLTKALCIIGGDADVDRYLEMSRSNVQDIRATVLLGKAQALQRKFDDQLINGTGAGSPLQMEGLDKILGDIGGAQTRITGGGANGASLNLNELDTLIDLVQGNRVDFLLMSKRSRRSLNTLFRTTGSTMETRNEFGRFIAHYNTIPVILSDWISDAQTVGTSVDCSVIYAGVLGEADGGLWCAYNSGGKSQPIMIEDVGALETKDAWRTRVKMYPQLLQGSAVTLARLTGVRP